MPFQEAEALQGELVRLRKQGEIPDQLLLLEHPPVITLGRAAGLDFLKGDPSQVPIPVVRTGRGGEITYHGPGQLVAYPILHLQEGERDLHVYLRRLEQVVLELCADFGIVAGLQKGRTGVWVGERKLASIGVRASSWVTSHGLALNYASDLSGFDWMEPCGLVGVTMTSMTLETSRQVWRADLEERLYTHFGRVFQREVTLPNGQ